MNTRKLFGPSMTVLCFNFLCLLTLSVHAKQNPGFISPGHVAAMQEEREHAPIDKIELAKAQERFKPRPQKFTKRGTPKKQRKISKTLRYMTYDETKAGKDRLLAAGNHTIALKYQERMIKLCDDLDELEALLLEFADTHRMCKHYDKAAALYAEFAHSYPGSTHVEYALYQAIECSSQLILDAERDQTNTKKTIELADQFLEKADLFAHYTNKVIEIRDHCYTLLARSECNVYKFHLNNGDYTQAERRLSGLRTDWLAKIPAIEPELLALEKELATKQNNLELAATKQQELTQKFPDASLTVAQHDKPKSFLTKF